MRRTKRRVLSPPTRWPLGPRAAAGRGDRRVDHDRPAIHLELGRVLVLLLVLLLGSALGPALGAADRSDPAAPTSQGDVDLTRHTNVIVPGVEGSRGSLDVPCPDGTVIGGGSSAGRNLRIVESRPHGIRSWRVSWLQTAADDTVVYAYAVCLTSEGV